MSPRGVGLAILIALGAGPAGCDKRDPGVDRLEARIEEMSRDLAALKKELAYLQAKGRGDQAEAPLPRPGATVTPPVVWPPSTDMAACDAYLRAVDAFAECDELPDASRAAARRAAANLRETWSTKMPDDAKAAAAGACKQGEEALRQGADALGCKL